MTYGMLIDLKRCVGCHACSVACKEAHGTRPGVRRSRVEREFEGTYPDVRKTSLPLLCMHCEVAPCVEVCPTGAHHKDEETGIVSITADDCIGCQSCVKACPYGAPQFVEAKTITEKCDMCAELQAHGEEPACVAICPQRALKIGDIDELRAEYGDVRDIQPLPDSAQTEPNVVIVAHRNGRAAADDDWRMLSLEQ